MAVGVILVVCEIINFRLATPYYRSTQSVSSGQVRSVPKGGRGKVHLQRMLLSGRSYDNRWPMLRLVRKRGQFSSRLNHITTAMKWQLGMSNRHS